MKHPMERLMPGRKPGTSDPKMLRALELVMEHGWTRTAAAREAGVTVGRISQSRVYQMWAEKQAAGAAQNKGE